jgi:hypothetical protein
VSAPPRPEPGSAPPSLLARLNTEWEHLAAASATAAALRRWACAEPVLAGWRDLEALRAAVHDRARPGRADEILAALVRHAATDGHHDRLAARVVLQLLLPGAVHLASSLRPQLGDTATAHATVLSELAVGIATYPWRRRPRRVAANLLLDCRQRITRRLHRHRLELAAGLGPHQERPDTRPVEEADGAVAVTELLDWAQRHRILNRFESQLLLASHVQDIPMQRLATALGRSRSGLFATRAAAEQRLRHALDAGRHGLDGDARPMRLTG